MREMVGLKTPVVTSVPVLLQVEVGMIEKRLRHPLSTKSVAHLCRRLFLEVRDGHTLRDDSRLR